MASSVEQGREFDEEGFFAVARQVHKAQKARLALMLGITIKNKVLSRSATRTDESNGLGVRMEIPETHYPLAVSLLEDELASSELSRRIKESQKYLGRMLLASECYVIKPLAACRRVEKRCYSGLVGWSDISSSEVETPQASYVGRVRSADAEQNELIVTRNSILSLPSTGFVLPILDASDPDQLPPAISIRPK
ncbi:hypothetical protein CSA80_04605 [Candidatus Saccharibacteria bacterium]|nr:MAG: hypothetical protein CSA80_04605 [Candidatus Saccharibacteria bacterium]